MQRNFPARHTSKIRRHRKAPVVRIAIIVRTKDRPHLLTRSLQSLAEQKRLPDEIIVVNDGGVAIDNVVSEFSDLNIHLIDNATNQGRARAGNQGVQATDSDVIGFLDDDDRFLPDHLQRLEKAMLHFDAKVAYSGCRLLKRDMLGDKVILQEKAIGQFNDPYKAERLRYENYIPLINLLIDRALWQNVGGFDESFEVFEDWDVLLRLSTHTSFYHVNRITTEYAVWGSSQITQRIEQLRWREAYSQFLEKHLMPLPEPEKLECLVEYWRVSQERRGIMQDTTVEKQTLQLQLIQKSQTLEQLQSQLSQSQAQNQQLQRENAQLQADWTRKYERLQTDYTQLQADWTKKYEQLQVENAKELAQLQSGWTTKYERLQSDYAQLQADWTAKYQQLQTDYTQLQSGWTSKYQQLQSDSAKDLAQLQADWTAKYQQLQSDSAKGSAQLQADWTAKYQQLQSDYTQLQSDWIAKYQQLQSDSAKEMAQLQSDWHQKYERLQSASAKEKAQLQADWREKYEQLQSDSAKEKAQLQADWREKYEQLQSDSVKQYTKLLAEAEKQQAEMQVALTELQKRYTELQTAAQQEQQQSQSLQDSLHELSKQMAVGLNQSAIEKILQSQPTAYALATSTGGVIDDYQRLVNWIRDRAGQLAELEQHFSQQIEPLYTEYHHLRTQSADLIKLISASHWPQIRRYANQVQAIDKQAEKLFSLTEHTISISTDIGAKLGLKISPKLPVSTGVVSKAGELPPPRPLSDVYPTFICIAGTSEYPQFMESVKEMGTVPFLLNAGEVLVFTVYCTLDNFCRVDILLGTRLRINTCQVRLIIRDLETKTPLHVLYLDAIEIFDNRFQPIHFDAITDSAGKTYQIEIDSPDANEHSGIAVWCHPKKPPIENAQRLPESITQRSPNTLPHWVQQSLLDLPLSAQLGAESATLMFLVSGITESTPVLDLHVFLGRLSQALKQADSRGQVVVAGQFSREVLQYCQQHQLTILDNNSLLSLFQSGELHADVNGEQGGFPTALDNAHLDLPILLEWGKTHLKSRLEREASGKSSLEREASGQVEKEVREVLTAEYLWCCELNALPQPEIVERAMEMFAASPNAGLLVPMEKQSDGRIRAGYASLVRDGLLRTLSAGAPADHPYHGYRRTIDAASSQLIIIKTACLSQLDISEISRYHTPMYQLTELIWQLKTQQTEALYEAALCYEHDRPYPEMTEPDYNHDSRYFYQRWRDKLPTHTATFAHLGDLLNPQQQPTVLVIDATLPMFDEDSGSLRLYTLLKIWASLGYRITFIADNLDSQFKYRHALEALGIEVFHGEYRIADAMAYRQFDFAFICRVEVGHRYMPFVRLLSPKTVIFYDTVDIHFIREQRQAEIENDPGLVALAQATKRKELYNCKMADNVITVTEDDGYHLQEELPELHFSVIPNIHQLQPLPETSFEQREGLVFIGNYDHPPNEDAVYYFVENVLPKIHANLPNICLYLIGSNMKDKMNALAGDDVKVVGWVDRVEPEFAKRRVFVSYLRYGAGMKGKLGQALSLGLPIVTTTIGAEGMGLVEEETALIADDPASFAEAVCRLYTDSALWEKLSRQGRDYIEQHFGEMAVRDKLRDLLAKYSS
jgi:glycosyltransferase involved in cell wall biosynthesis